MTGQPEYNCGVYSITSPSGNKYIGSSQSINKRWREHKSDLSKNRHHSRALQRAWVKYNGDLKFELLLVCEVKDLILYEQQFIDFYNPRYNCSPTAGSMLGVKLSKETRAKMSASHMGVPVSQEARMKIALSKIGKPRPSHVIEAVRKAANGRKCPESTKQWFRDNRSGVNHPCYGKKLSQETKDKISKAHKGKRHTKEAIEKIRVTNTGRKHSAESIVRMQEARKQFWIRNKNAA